MRDIFRKLYTQQKSNAKQRGVEFRLTLEEWKQIWLDSGKWEQRGRGADKYCMCRIGDTGAYEVGNVFIALNTSNLSEGNLGRVLTDEHKAKIAAKNSGKPHPWSVGEKNPMHRPEAKAKIKDATGGTKHYRSKGGVVTPEGFLNLPSKPLPHLAYQYLPSNGGASIRNSASLTKTTSLSYKEPT